MREPIGSIRPSRRGEGRSELHRKRPVSGLYVWDVPPCFGVDSGSGQFGVLRSSIREPDQQDETLDEIGAPLTVPLLSQSRCCRLGDIVTKGRKQRVREFKALKGDAARSRIIVDSSGVLHSGEPILATSGFGGGTSNALRLDKSQFKLLDNTSGSQFKLSDNTSGSQFKPLIDTSGSQFKLLDNTSGSQFKPLIDASGSQFKLLDNTGGSQTSCKQESVQAARRQEESVQAARPPGGVCSSRRAPRGVCSSRKASRGSLFKLQGAERSLFKPQGARRSLFKPQGAERSLFKPQGLQEESVQAAGRQEESVQAARVAGAPGGGAKKEEKTTDNGGRQVTLIYPQRAAKTHGSVALKGNPDPSRRLRSDRAGVGSPHTLDQHFAIAILVKPPYERWQPARGSVPPDETFERAGLCESGFDALR
ncbi:transcription initiation factor TFIIE subunit beta [Apiospora arundinis]